MATKNRPAGKGTKKRLSINLTAAVSTDCLSPESWKKQKKKERPNRFSELVKGRETEEYKTRERL